MAIILEGPDAAGKTTLGRLFAGQFGMKLVVSGGAPKTKAEVIEYCEMQLLHCHERNAVIDRVTPISHPIYNPAYRNSELLQEYLAKMLQHQEVVIVYCRPPLEALMRPEKHVWKDYDTEEHKQKVLRNQFEYIQMYDNFFNHTSHVPYDYTRAELDDSVELIAMLAATQHNPEYIQKLRSFHVIGSYTYAS